MLLALLAQPCASTGESNGLLQLMWFLVEREKAQKIKAEELRANYTTSHSRAPELGIKHFPLPPLEMNSRAVLSVTHVLSFN